MVVVVNMRTTPDFGRKPGDVRIDRQTKWGNPFPMRGERDRDRVCDEYEKWFERKEREGVLNIRELRNAKRLGCWCKPKRCHGDYLKRRIDEMNSGGVTAITRPYDDPGAGASSFVHKRDLLKEYKVPMLKKAMKSKKKSILDRAMKAVRK